MNTDTAYQLDRFVKAQGNNRVGNYTQILATIKAGQKVNNGLWHIFPRYIDLEDSRQSEFFGIVEFDEAVQYLADPVLGDRLREITQALLICKDRPISDLFTEKDTAGVQSCMTLFDRISPDDIFAEVLNVFYAGKRCEPTLNRIAADTRPLSFELQTETIDIAKIDRIVEDSFPEFADTLTSQSDYHLLKEEALSFKALVYKANTMNEDLLGKVEKALETHIGNTGEYLLLVSVVFGYNEGKESVRDTERIRRRFNSLNAIFRAFNGNRYDPFWSVSNRKTGLNFTFIVVYLK